LTQIAQLHHETVRLMVAQLQPAQAQAAAQANTQAAHVRQNLQTAQLWQQLGDLEMQIIQLRLAATQDPQRQTFAGDAAATNQTQNQSQTQSQPGAPDATATTQNQGTALPNEEALWQQIAAIQRQILETDMNLALQMSAARTTNTGAADGPETRRVLRPPTGSGIRLNFTPGPAGDLRLQRAAPQASPSQNLPPDTESATPQPVPGTGVSRQSAGSGAVTPQSGSGTSVAPSN
jgi:hypothetical protein